MHRYLTPALSVLAALHATTALSQPLSDDAIELDELVISANRVATPQDKTGASVSVLSESEIRADDRPFVLQQLTTLPGVTFSQNGAPGSSSGFAIRGASEQYVRVYVDGIEISDPTGTQVSPSLSGLLTGDISRVEVLRGSQSALYGGQAVGGVIDITSSRATEDGFQTRYTLEGGSYNTFRGNLGFAGRDERGEFSLDISNYTTDGFSSADEDDGNSEDDGFETTRISGTGRINTSEAVALFGSAFWQTQSGDYDRGFPISDADFDYDSEQWGARFGADIAPFGSRLAHQLAMSYFDVEREYNDDFPYSTEGNRIKAEYLGNLDWSDILGFQFGADWSKETTDPSNADKEDSAITGIFGQADWSPIYALTVNAALRLDEHSEFGSYTSGRLTGAYELPTETVLRASLGSGFRPPSNYELFSLYGNPDLDPETSLSADLGVEQAFAGGRGNVSATLFWLEIEDLIEYDFATSAYAQSDGTSESKGVELAAAWEITEALSLLGSYTYTDAEDADGEDRDRIPRHDFSVSLAGAVNRISYGLEARYVADYTDGGTADTENFDEDFTVVNARVAYALTDQAEVYLRAENLFDAEYQTARGYGTSDQAFFAGIRGTF
ncbi:TonB-dependent receptor plug domain-containing protein [Amaricoccus macauensis]|uniref:TonB-dependent receptor plug domain-containing protein n=1 Tax=Amaricoccus macauensis TaxID=57001 RepID=UPI003C7E8F14